MAVEQDVALPIIAENRRDLLLALARVKPFLEQALLGRFGYEINFAAIDIMVARHQQQAVFRRAAELLPEPVEPSPRELILVGPAGERQIAGDRHQVWRQPPPGLFADEIGQRPQHRIGIPGLRRPEMDVRQMQQPNRPVVPCAPHPPAPPLPANSSV